MRSFSEAHKNIVLINQDNMGNGAARNTGVVSAKGDYLCFIDSDDYLSKNVLNNLREVLEIYDLDMLGFDSQVVTNSDFVIAKPVTLNLNGYQPIKVMEFIKESNYKAEVWWYFVKKSFFKDCGIKFYDRKFVQDSYLTPTLLLESNSFLYLSIDAHRYRKHNNSITKNQSRKHISKHMSDMFFAIEKLSDLTNGIKEKDCLKRG